MERDYLNVLIFGHTTFGTRHLRIRRETFKVVVYLLAFFQLSVMFFLCDYVQIKRRQIDSDQLRQELQIQKAQIQSFSTKIKEVEKRLSKLKVIDQRIRAIANLDGNQAIPPFIGIGGPSSPPVQERLTKVTDRPTNPF